jgi:hypothetical protein
MIKVWNGEKAVKNDIYLKLVETEEHVMLSVCDEDGTTCPGGHLLYIKDNGSIVRVSHVNSHLGIDVVDGKVNVR